MWTPQIIYNVIYNNKFIYPFCYIISSTMERFFYCVYFRGYDGNFLRIKGDKLFICLILLYQILICAILYLQAIKGPRFFLCKKYKKEEYNFYRTKEELIKSTNNAVNVECVICLMPIFCDEKNENTEINNSNNIINETNNKLGISIDKNIQIIEMTKIKNEYKKNMKKCKKINLGLVCKILFYEGFFYFYKMNKNKMKKYMQTPCNHIFHTKCLEEWILRKKVCPNCRFDLSDKIF